MEEKVFQAALAGLLHDIGKFAREQALGYDEMFAEIVPDCWRNMAYLSNYTNPLSTHLESVVILADRLVAGGYDQVQSELKPLQSIFASLEQSDSEKLTKKYLPLQPLALAEEVIFPVHTVNASKAAYEELWKGFVEAAKKLRDQLWTEDQQNAYLLGLLDLLQRYTWCIPSTYCSKVPDVSLYNHSRMTAAMAACLVTLEESQIKAWIEEQDHDQAVALLVGGDISGVQKFIYTITSSGAAKSLRGRSFYLQLLTEAVAHYTLDQLNLPITNLIYAGGGNFFLLAQVCHQEQLQKIARKVSGKLLQAHEGELYLILADTPLTATQLKATEFHTAWDQLHSELNRAKLKPLTTLEDEVLAGVIGAGMGIGGDRETLCHVCGRENSQPEEKESGGEVIRICPMCESFEELGNRLARATHLVTLYSLPRDHRHIDRWWQSLELFGVNIWAIDANETGQPYLKLSENVHLVDLTILDPKALHAQALQAELANSSAVQLQTFHLFAQLVPTNRQGLPLTFDELAEATASKEQRWSGLKRWGVLRMDVDNLGTLFSQGFKTNLAQSGAGVQINNLTLSRLATLSFALRLFFEGWLPQLGKAQDDSKRLEQRLYIQYAGGDDLFVVGSWDALPEFALKIRESFNQYVCENPRVTLSGGVALATMKYPLYQAAEEAEKTEKTAKDYRRDSQNRSKNAFHFLGQTVGWEDFRKVMERAYKLAEWCGENGPVSRALLQTLQSIHEEYNYGRKEALKNKKWKPDQPYFGPWMWHLAYQLARRSEGKHIPEPIKEELRGLESKMLTGRQSIETIGLAARWAQYLIRK